MKVAAIIAGALIVSALIIIGVLTFLFPTSNVAFDNRMTYSIRILCPTDPAYLGPAETATIGMPVPTAGAVVNCSIEHQSGQYVGCLTLTPSQLDGSSSVAVSAATVNPGVREKGGCLVPYVGS